jgi:Tfp pilus tip-associated adhesin PilY1
MENKSSQVFSIEVKKMKTLQKVLIIVSLLLIFSPFQLYGATMADFSAYPPFITNFVIPPNILLVLDHSGSMQFPAYQKCNHLGYSQKRSVCESESSFSSSSSSYNPMREYYGYFKTNKYYKPSSNGMVENASCDYSDTVGGTDCISGNLLNWATMSRIDLMRKALIGGKSLSPQNSNTHTLSGEGGMWSFSDANLGCTFTVSGGNYPQLDHELTISPYDFGGTCDSQYSDNFDDNSLDGNKWSGAAIDLPSGYEGSQEETGGTLKIHSEGTQLWSYDDHCRFVYQSISGNFDVRVEVKNVADLATFSKGGLMIRRSLASNDKTVMALVTHGSGIQFAARAYQGYAHNLIGYVYDIEAPAWVRIVRSGSTFYFFYSKDGQNWNYYDSTIVYQMGYTVLVGMAGATYSAGNIGTFEFDNFQSCMGDCKVGTVSGVSLKVDVPEKERRGVIHALSDKDYDGDFDPGTPRFGLMVYNSGTNSGCMKVGIEGSNMSSFLNALQSEPPYNGTNTGEAVMEAIEYLRQVDNYDGCNNNNFIGGPSSSKDPWYDQNIGPNICRKSFIMVVSDGQWTGTIDPVLPARISHVNDMRTDPGMDGKQVINYYSVYTFSDSAGGRNSLAHLGMFGDFDDFDKNNYPYPYNSYHPYPSDSRDVTPPPAECNPLSADDSCMEWDKNIDGFADSFYEADDGNKLEATLIDAILDIIRRASSGTAVSVLSTSGEGEGTVYQAYFNSARYFGANEVKWLGFLHSLFVDKYGNMRANTHNPSIAQLDYGLDSNKNCNEANQDYIVRYYFDVIRDMTMLKYYTDTKCDGEYDGFFEDMDGDGNLDEYYTPVSGLPPISIEKFTDYIWEAGRQLYLRDPNDPDPSLARKIYTTLDGTAPLEFVDTNAEKLKDFLQAEDIGSAEDLINYIRGVDITGYRSRTYDGKVWKLGDIVYSTPKSVSKPVENYDMLYSDRSYRFFRDKYEHRRTVVYIGANDGMLHAFNGGFYDVENQRYWRNYTNTGFTDSGIDLGEELWAFIPKSALPHLQWYADPFYTHVYYVDGEPKISDVRIFNEDDVHPFGWGTILIGSMRFGGKKGTDVMVCSGDPSIACFDDSYCAGAGQCTGEMNSSYFALDVTNPLNPELLWTFDDPDNLGLTTSYPAVIKTADPTKGEKWFVVFGSGPTTYNGTSAQNASVYVLDITGVNGKVETWTEGSNYWRKEVTDPAGTPDPQALMANPISVDVDLDFDVDVIYIGNTYCPDKAVCPLDDPGFAPSPWAGRMYRLNISNQGQSINPSTWQLSTLYGSTTEPLGPITSAPSAAMDEQGNLWLYFGEGRFFTNDDKLYLEDSAPDAKDGDHYNFYGIKDVCKPWKNDNCGSIKVCSNVSVSTNPIPPANIIDVTYKEVSSPVCSNNSSQYCSEDSQCWANPDIPEEGVHCDKTPAEDDFRLHLFGDGSTKGARDCDSLGWKYTFPQAGEQTYTKPLVLGGLVVWATQGFSNDFCSSEGESFIYAVYYETGTAYEDEVFDTNPKEETIARRKELGKGLPSSVGAFVSGDNKVVGFSQTSTGTIVQIELNTAIPVKSGFEGWKSEKIKFDVPE